MRAVRRERVAVLRPDPARPGQKAQVDYGKLGRWRDPQTGRQSTIWAFGMVLCASREHASLGCAPLGC